ncbi:unnamed protein product [Amoebophrya sp. A120]|nr:unnamed protein product [Amoebophrya sp. A120]|eukprot:GSA120T00016466001.1
MEDAAAPALGLAATGALGVGSFAAGKKGMDAIYRHLDEKDEKEYQEKKKAKAARKKARAEKRAQIQAMLAEQEEKHEGAGADAAATTRPETYPPAGEEVATPVDEQQAEVGGGSSRAINSTPARLPATENEEQAVGRGAEGAGTRASVSDTGDAGLAATTRELQSEVGSSTTAGAPPQEAERTAAGGNAGVAVTSEGSAGRKQDSAGAEAEAEEDIAAGEAAEEVAQPLADEPTPTGGPETTASGRALADETGTEAEEPSTTDRGLSGGEDEQAGQQEEDLTSSSRAAEDQEGPSTVAAAATAPGRGEPSDTLPPLFPSSTTQSAGANGGAEEAEPANTGVDITSARPEEERGGLSREQGHGRSSEQQQEGVSGPPSQVQPETVAADAQAPLQPQLPVEGTTTMAGDDTTSGSAGSAPSTFPSSTDASSVPPGGPGTISSDALIASSPYRVGVMDKHGRVMELGPYKPPYEGGSSGQNRGDTASGTVVPPATAAPSGSATAAPPNAEQPEPEDDPAVEPTSAFLQRGNTKTIDEGGPSSKVGNRAEHSSSQQEIDVSVEKTTRTAGGGVEPRFTLHEEHDNSARTTGANGMKPETTTIPPVVPFKKTNLRRRKNHSSQMHGSPLQMVMQISSSAEEVESEQPAVPPVGEEDELLPEMQHGETLRKTATSGVEQQTVLAVKKTPHFRAHRKKHLQKTGGEEGVIQSTAVVAAVDENINPGQQIGGAFETANEFSTTTTGTSLPGGNIQTATSTSDAGRSASGLRGNESRTSTTDHGEFSHQNEGKASTKMNYQPSPSFRSGSTSSFLSGATYFYGLCGAVFFVLLVGMAVYFLPCLRSWSRGKSKILGQKHVHPHAGTNNKDARTHGAAGGGGLMHA